MCFVIGNQISDHGFVFRVSKGEDFINTGRLRHRVRKDFSGFTTAEIEKLKKLFEEFGEQPLDQEFCLKVASAFSCSAGHAGKARVKWNEIKVWFQNKQRECSAKTNPMAVPLKETASLPDVARKLEVHPDACTQLKDHEQFQAVVNPLPAQLKEITYLPDVDKMLVTCPDSDLQKKADEANEVPEGEKFIDALELEFEARSSRDGAWYDVDRFLTHRVVSSGEDEVCVRFIGFGAEDDEWVNVKKSLRERSVPLEHWECYKIRVGDLILCFQESKDQALYYDAHVVEILRRMHDIRGCRCIFLVRYNHDRSEERVRLRRLCRRPA
ncbi:hypothetical protein Nepgr_014256 [Nepenthes gracilis]|uniref:Homeobox domain-containing protein n=1 Tax=Nepenthes gracilis TaxID=150966 RepID=A0AAD3SKC1_NEPGR|nr:hypothetical protein Nepgr_014256 [Nepenthes gracilis]